MLARNPRANGFHMVVYRDGAMSTLDWRKGKQGGRSVTRAATKDLVAKPLLSTNLSDRDSIDQQAWSGLRAYPGPRMRPRESEHIE